MTCQQVDERVEYGAMVPGKQFFTLDSRHYHSCVRRRMCVFGGGPPQTWLVVLVAMRNVILIIYHHIKK